MKLRPGIKQRGKAFVFTISMGFDGNGKQIRKYHTHRPPEGLTEKQLEKNIEAAYDEFKAKIGGNKSQKDSMKLSQLSKMFFDEFAPNRLKESTAYTYHSSYRTNIKPVLGNIRLKDLTTSRITDFLVELGKTKKASTVRKHKIILHSILSYAVSQKYIKENPCIGTIWKNDVETEYQKIENVLNEHQAKTLMNLTAEYSVFGTIIRLLLLTGIRSGEALSLTWDKVSFEEKTIFIDKTLTYTTGHYFLSTPKTPASIRKLAIDDKTVELLKKHKEEQDKQKAIVGDAWLHPEMVFTSCTGHYYDRSLLNTQLRRFLKKHPELPKITIHGLRHTNATLLILKGENLDAISKHLGHSSSDITSRVYAHTLASVEKRIADTISTLLF